MERIQNLIKNNQPSSEYEKKPRLPTETISTLWVTLTELYGSKFVSQYGEEPCTSWIVGLHGLSPKHIKRGIRNVVESGEDWPPSLPKFRKMCFAGEGWQSRKEYVPQLTHEPSEEELKENIEKVKELRAILLGCSKDDL